MNQLKRIIATIISIVFLLPSVTWTFDLVSIGLSTTAQQVTIPKKWGEVIATGERQKQTIICIQDLHCDYEVQKNIAALIDYLADHHDLYLVGQEGAVDTIQPNEIRDFNHRLTKQAVADHYMKQGELTGAEYAAALSKKQLLLTGIETPDLYEESYQQLQSFYNHESQGLIFDLRDQLDSLKPGVYNQALKKIEQRFQAYRHNRMTTIAYAAALMQQAESIGIETEAYPAVKTTLFSNHFKLPATVEAGRVQQELVFLEAAVRRYYYDHQHQHQLDRLVRRVDMMEKLLSLSMTPQELDEFRHHRERFQTNNLLAVIATIRTQQPFAHQSTQWPRLDQYLQQAERFYDLADQRSDAFVGNLADKMANHQQSLAVMVHGGFHSPQIIKALQNKQIGYLLVKPHKAKQDIINPYFDLLQNQQGSLEQLLAGPQDVYAIPTGWSRQSFRDKLVLTMKMLARVTGHWDSNYAKAYEKIKVVPAAAGQGWQRLTTSVNNAAHVLVTTTSLGLDRFRHAVASLVIGNRLITLFRDGSLADQAQQAAVSHANRQTRWQSLWVIVKKLIAPAIVDRRTIQWINSWSMVGVTSVVIIMASVMLSWFEIDMATPDLFGISVVLMAIGMTIGSVGPSIKAEIQDRLQADANELLKNMQHVLLNVMMGAQLIEFVEQDDDVIATIKEQVKTIQDVLDIKIKGGGQSLKEQAVILLAGMTATDITELNNHYSRAQLARIMIKQLLTPEVQQAVADIQSALAPFRQILLQQDEEELEADIFPPIKKLVDTYQALNLLSGQTEKKLASSEAASFFNHMQTVYQEDDVNIVIEDNLDGISLPGELVLALELLLAKISPSNPWNKSKQLTVTIMRQENQWSFILQDDGETTFENPDQALFNVLQGNERDYQFELALLNQVVTSLGGTVQLINNVNQGITVTTRLDLDQLVTSSDRPANKPTLLRSDPWIALLLGLPFVGSAAAGVPEWVSMSGLIGIVMGVVFFQTIKVIDEEGIGKPEAKEDQVSKLSREPGTRDSMQEEVLSIFGSMQHVFLNMINIPLLLELIKYQNPVTTRTKNRLKRIQKEIEEKFTDSYSKSQDAASADWLKGLPSAKLDELKPDNRRTTIAQAMIRRLLPEKVQKNIAGIQIDLKQLKRYYVAQQAGEEIVIFPKIQKFVDIFQAMFILGGLNPEGLPTMQVGRLFKQMKRAHGKHDIELTMNSTSKDVRLPGEVVLAFRLLMQRLTPANQWNGSTKLKIETMLQNQVLTVCMQDNGKRQFTDEERKQVLTNALQKNSRDYHFELALLDQVVTNLGGSVTLINNLEQGITLWVTLNLGKGNNVTKKIKKSKLTGASKAALRSETMLSLLLGLPLISSAADAAGLSEWVILTSMASLAGAVLWYLARPLFKRSSAPPMSIKLGQLPGVKEKVINPQLAYNETWYADNLGARLVAELTDSLFHRPASRLAMVVSSQSGDRFSADWNTDQDVFEIHVPPVYRKFFAQGDRFRELNPWQHPLDALLILTLRFNLHRALNKYKQQIIQDFQSFEQEVATNLWEYGAAVLLRVQDNQLPRASGQRLLHSLYGLPAKPTVTGMVAGQINQLLAMAGTAIGEIGTYWDKGLTDGLNILLRQGRLPSAAMVISSLQAAEQRALEQDDQFRAVQLMTMRQGIKDAVQSKQPEVIQSQITYVLACVLQRRELSAGMATWDHDLALTAEEQTRVANTTVQWLMDIKTRRQLQQLAATLAKQASPGLIRQNLEWLSQVLKQSSLDHETSAKLLKLMQMSVPVAAVHQAEVIGYDLNHTVGLAMDHSGVKQDVTLDEVDLILVQPAIYHAFSTSDDQIVGLRQHAQSSSAIWLAPVNVRQFGQIVTRQPGFDRMQELLRGNLLYDQALAPDDAIAEAYYQAEADHPSATVREGTQRRLIRTIMRVANYHARLVDQGDVAAADYRQGLLAMNRLISQGGYWPTVMMGSIKQPGEEGIAVLAPNMLKLGGQYALSYLWEKRIEGFTLIKSWADQFMRRQLRHFRINSAA